MDSIVFFPTNNIGKYDRYKRSFEKIGMQYERYYIKGEGSFYKSRVLSDSGEILDSSMSFNKVPKGSLAISKEFYDYLKNIMGNDVQYKSEDVEEKGYLPLDVEDYF